VSDVAHPGLELVERFILEGEYGVLDLAEAWRTCALALAAFHGLTVRRLMELELLIAEGIDDAPDDDLRDFVLAGVDGDRDRRAGVIPEIAGW